MGFQLVTVLVLLLVAGVRSFDYDYSIYTGDSFEAFCGNETNKQMEIVYRGDAIAVYAPQNTGCFFTETEPAQFEIHDAMTDPLCYPNKEEGMEVYSLEVIIQKNNVHMYDDPFYLVTCSYELKGSGSTSLSADTSGGGSEKTPMFVSAVNATSRSTFTLAVRDVHNRPITSVRIGAFMQLVVFMEPGGDEVSFRVLKCFAFSNSTGVYAEYNFLVDGCGDGDVIKKNRGFLTAAMTSDNGTTMRVAKSVFFRAFSLMGNSGLAFECEYVITKDASADGASCASAPAAAANAGKRKRRRKKRSADHLFETSSVLNMDKVISNWIKLLPRAVNEEGVLTYSLRAPEDKAHKEGGQTRTEADFPNGAERRGGGDEHSLTTLMMAFLKTLSQGVTGGRQQQPSGGLMRQQTQEEQHTVQHVLQQPLVICLIVACVLFFTTPITVVIMVHQFQRGGWPGPQHDIGYKRMPYQRFVYPQSPTTPT